MKQNPPIAVYLSCSYTAQQDFPTAARMFESLANHLWNRFEGSVLFFVPHCHTWAPFRDGNPPIEHKQDRQSIFQIDKQALEQCDMVLALLTLPSHGVGAEVAFALGNNKPVLGFSFNHVSLFLQGMLIEDEGGKLYETEHNEYDGIRAAGEVWDEIADQLDLFLTDLANRENGHPVLEPMWRNLTHTKYGERPDIIRDILSKWPEWSRPGA